MSHYEERLEQDLLRIRERIGALASQVQEGLENAIRALQTGNHELAAATIIADHRINRAMRENDRLCHAFIAVHLPSAGHLRFLSSAIRANIALERIGDYAVTIARVSERLSAPPTGELGRELQRFENQAQLMFKQAATAFNELNPEMAKATMVMEREMEYDLDTVYSELTARTERERVKELLSVFAVLTHLKRVADQAKNLCEETVFAVTGETKAPKVYNILFVDEDNSGLSQMAEAIARKSYPGSGHYSSGGRQPAAALNPAMVQFLEDRGFDLTQASPKGLELTHQDLVEKHLIVSLQGSVKDYISEIPFHTTALEWDVGALPGASDTSATNQDLEMVFRTVSVHVRDLMQTLRGQDAP